MGQPLVLGVDVGTSSTKVILVDESGKVLGQGAYEYPTVHPQPGWAEQDPQWWMEGLCEGCRQALSSSGRYWGDVAGLSITHQRQTIIPVDKDMNPVYNGILWSDARASEECSWAAKTLGAEAIFRQTGCCVPGLWSVYKALWLRRKRPDMYKHIHRILLIPDWMIYRLTGKLFTSEGTAATSGALDISHKRRWNVDLLQELGLSPHIFADNIVPAGVAVGTVTKDAENEFGIPAGLAVVTAAGDQPCGSFGAGQLDYGTLSVNGGTSCTSEMLCKGLPSFEHPNYFVEISPTGAYILEAAIYSGASDLMKWYRRNFGLADEIRARKTRVNVWTTIYEMAEAAPVGNLGLVMLPFLRGAGAPFWNLDSKGALLGLSTDHGRTHLVRAIIEGLAYQTRHLGELMAQDVATPIESVIAYGGSTRSMSWNQTLADITGKLTWVCTNADTTALGAAMCAAAGVGIYQDVETAGEFMKPELTQIVPREVHAQFYDRFYHEVYLGLYDSLIEKLAMAHTLAATYIDAP